MIRKKRRRPSAPDETIISLDILIEGLSTHFHGILRENLYEMDLSKERMELLTAQKKILREALKNCGVGDNTAKNYVKDAIRNVLLERYKITADNITMLINYDYPEQMTAQDLFEILMYRYEKKYGKKALEKFLKKYRLGQLRSDGEEKEIYEVTESDIRSAYAREVIRLDFLERLNIVVQRVYENYKGLGCVDIIRDMAVDGVSGGVSGSEEEEHSVWVFFQGKSIYFSFLSFGSHKELERVCRNIYRYGNPGQLSETRGYVVGEMADQARVVVARPPFAENWVFFVRKFDSLEAKNPEDLISDANAEIPIMVMKWLIRGCQVTGITGAQGSGKTTLLMSLIRYIPPIYTLRIQELAFELHLRKLYPKRNIVTFRETSSISGQEGLDLQKKTDGVVNILGEVATAEVGSWMIQMGMAASMFTLFTHHAKTTRDLVLSLRNGLLQTSNFRNEKVAEQQVVDVVRFDIHMEKDASGHRYIEKITEIIPLEVPGDDGRMFRVQDIVVWQQGAYYLKSPFSRKTEEDIRKHLSQQERKAFDEEFFL